MIIKRIVSPLLIALFITIIQFNNTNTFNTANAQMIYDTLDSKIEYVKSDVSSLKERIKSLETTTTAQDGKISSITNIIQLLKESIDGNSDDDSTGQSKTETIKDLSLKVRSLEDSVAKLKDIIKAQQAMINDLNISQ
jgi:predicted RNase H-like nuclease (RuvC/YqgF family)